MAVKVNHINDAVVVTVKGKLMGGGDTQKCHDTVKDLLRKKEDKIVLDISKIKWMNSQGLGAVMACFTSCKNAGAEFRVAGATEKTKSLFITTKLLEVFENYESLQDAVDSF